MTTGDQTEDAPRSEATGSPLSDSEIAVLHFARLHWKYPGAMETAVREQFGWSPTRYFQVLNALLERPEAHAYDPLLVSRLRRLRDLRQEQRRGRRETSRG